MQRLIITVILLFVSLPAAVLSSHYQKDTLLIKGDTIEVTIKLDSISKMDETYFADGYISSVNELTDLTLDWYIFSTKTNINAIHKITTGWEYYCIKPEGSLSIKLWDELAKEITTELVKSGEIFFIELAFKPGTEAERLETVQTGNKQSNIFRMK